MMGRMAPRKRSISTAHKAAIAQGRSEAAVVRRYLAALEANKPKRGRKRTADSVSKRLEAVQAALDEAVAADRLELLQERRSLERELKEMSEGPAVDIAGLETEFVEVAAAYSQRKGIEYATWREFGVDPKVLRAAGISRSSR
jgi:hypothetical protein